MTSRSDGKGDPFRIQQCQHGEMRFTRHRADGTVQRGRLVPMDELPEEGLPAGASIVTSGVDEDGVRRVIEEIPLTGCRTRPANGAYRLGWDQTFAKTSGKKGAAN